MPGVNLLDMSVHFTKRFLLAVEVLLRVRNDHKHQNKPNHHGDNRRYRHTYVDRKHHDKRADEHRDGCHPYRCFD